MKSNVADITYILLYYFHSDGLKFTEKLSIFFYLRLGLIKVNINWYTSWSLVKLYK